MTSLHESFGVGSIVDVDETVVEKWKFNRGRSVKEVPVSSTSKNMPYRSLEYTKIITKRTLSNDKPRP